MQLTFIGTGDAFAAGGRYHSCMMLRAGREAMLVDLGGSAMLALQRAGIDRRTIATILFTHYHGDHFAGLPFFILDALFVSQRKTPLTIAGGGDVAARVRALMEATYPGFAERPKPFDIRYQSVAPGPPVQLGAFAVEAFPMVHDEAAGPCQGYRISHGGKVLAVTGDTTWTEGLLPLARGADVLVAECGTVLYPSPVHLNLKQLTERRADLAARRMILTHMGPDMLSHDGPLPNAEKAHDGMTVML
ncbi:MAG: MBL fold metallo-hydrolase [Proteobacteria bacterium]|nr:MBL fold metallo-hydrolase [Pseudomonadota bacterium]